VLVRIAAAGVNFVEIYMRRGIISQKLPYVLGWEAAGVVEALGEGVSDFKVGDRVAYVHQIGAYAEKSIVHADSLIPLPDDFSLNKVQLLPCKG